jgi:hypothetical protein
MSIDRLNVDIDQPCGEIKPARALAPFRIPAYRRLAVALVLSCSFASGIWVVTLGWGFECLRRDEPIPYAGDRRVSAN